MEQIFLKCLNMSFAAGWLILAAILLRMLLKQAPGQVKCWLWVPVVIRLILPFSLESIVSLIPSGEVLPQSALSDTAPQVQTGFDALNSAVNPVFTETFAPAVGDSVNPLQVVLCISGWVWVFGMCAMAAYSVGSLLRLRRQVRTAMSMGDGVYLCDSVASPFILGIFRPGIYLPSEMEEGQRIIVLAHERMHLRRGDHIWKPLGFLVLTIHWFNPLVWAAYLLFCRDIELACDEKVVADMDREGRLAYSETLLGWAMPRHAVSACPLAFGEVGVKSRIRTVLNYRKPSLWIGILAVVACAALAVCFLTDPVEATDGGNLVPPTTEENPIQILPAEPDLDINAITPFDVSFSRHRIGQVIYDDPDDDISYPTDNTYLFDLLGAYEFAVYETAVREHRFRGKTARFAPTENNFDLCFASKTNGWAAGFDPGTLREKNHAAWQAVFPTESGLEVYYILQQKDGTILLLIGETQPESSAWPRIYCAFVLEGLSGDYRQQVLDAVYADIDGDGEKEACFLTGGPTSGVASFGFVVKENGTACYNHCYYGWAHTFCWDEQGNLQISSNEGPLDIRIEDGKVVLYCSDMPYGSLK